MATPLKENGRTVRAWNNDAMMELNTAVKALVGTLGEVDPVIINRALRDALGALNTAQYHMNQIEITCALAAKRDD